MADTKPTIVWFRRDFRLSDHPALSAAAKRGAPLIPVFINDTLVTGLGAAPKWRLGEGLRVFSDALVHAGSALTLRSGDPLSVLQELIAQTGAGAVYWTRAYDPTSKALDTHIKAALKELGIEAKSFGGHLLFEPWTVQTKIGGYYKVYTPFWNAVKTREVELPLPAPSRLPAPHSWPVSERLADWAMGAEMRRGANIVGTHARIGEGRAKQQLDGFMEERVADYVINRDKPTVRGTSGLSAYLALGEISPHICWYAGRRAMHEGKPGAETFLKELVWREFAYHLMHHTPHILTGNWKPEWDAFPWNTDEDHPHVTLWKQGRTGVPFVDAAMREMYVTGTMHNRGRMIVASYLTKHLMCHWKIGLKWFETCLTDWDPASNAMGWQWSAGSGPDATPYFRIFNPVTQLDKFDPNGDYARTWIAEGQTRPPETASSYFDAIPESWALSPHAPYPEPIVSPAEGRAKALAAYQTR